MLFSKILSFIALSLLLSACGTVSNVSHYFPEEQHPQKAAKLIEFKPSLLVEKNWVVKIAATTAPKYVRLTPAVSKGLIFVPTHLGYLKALDQRTGKIRWQDNIGKHISAGVSAKYGKVFVATDSGDILALDQSTGKLLWKRINIASDILAAPLAANKIIFVKSIDGSLTAFSQSSGKKIWRYSQTVPSLLSHVSSSPVISGHDVMAGFPNGHLVALNDQTGAVIWDKLIKKPGTLFEGIDVSPVIKNGMVFVGGYQGSVVGLSLKSGRLIWRHKISGYSGISVDSNNLYITDSKSFVWAFTQDVGALLWRQKYLYYRQLSLPGSMKNYMVVGDGFGYLHWISKQTGHFAARTYLDGSGIVVKPIAVGQIIFVYTQAGNLYRLRILDIKSDTKPEL